jgi:hypothetical protein
LLVHELNSLKELSLLIDVGKHPYVDGLVDDIRPHIFWISRNQVEANRCPSARREQYRLGDSKCVQQSDDVVALLREIKVAVDPARAFQRAAAIVADELELLSKTPGGPSEFEYACTGAADREHGGSAANAFVMEFSAVDCEPL